MITTAAGTLNRKAVLVVLTAFMLLSLVLVAAAPNFTVLMVGRALLGICIGGFWALATALIMRLVPATEVPKALALIYGGQAIAAAFAAHRQLSGRHLRVVRGVLGADPDGGDQPGLACGRAAPPCPSVLGRMSGRCWAS